jgi:hypothetical protein
MTYWHTKQVVTDPGMFGSPLKKKWRISWAAVTSGQSRIVRSYSQ